MTGELGMGNWEWGIGNWGIGNWATPPAPPRGEGIGSWALKLTPITNN